VPPQPNHRDCAATKQKHQHCRVVVNDAIFMSPELLARALGRVKTLNIVKSTVSFGETLNAIVERAPDVAGVSTHLAHGLYLEAAAYASSATGLVN
jgi:hypothetical protein